MRDLAVLFIHLITTIARLAAPGGARSVVAESVLVKQQLLILNRSRHRSPNLRVADRLITGLCALLVPPRRLVRSAVVVKPSTLLNFHRVLVHRKYRLLFSPKHRANPDRKAQVQSIHAVIELTAYPSWGCPRIAEQIVLAFGVAINKDVVLILAADYHPSADGTGPSWLTFLGPMKDSLWSLDLFRAKSATLRTHWVLGVCFDSAPLSGTSCVFFFPSVADTYCEHARRLAFRLGDC